MAAPETAPSSADRASAADLARRLLGRLRAAPLGLTRALMRPATAFALLGGWFALMLALQVGLQTGGRNDDAELLLFTQALQLGYDAKNPPLVVWLTWAVMQATGPSLLAVRLVVLGSLFATYLFLWLAAREAMADRRLAVLAGLMPATMLYTAWTPFINMTHTILLGALVAATLWAALVWLRRPGWAPALGLGVTIGLGLLAKYNYALFLGGLALAVLAVPAARAALRDRRLLAVPALAAAAAGPHYLWLLGRLERAEATLHDKWGLDAPVAWADGALQGLGSLLQGSLSFLTPMLLLVAAVFWFAFAPQRRAAAPSDETASRRAARQVAGLTHLFVLALFAVVVLAGATGFATHHFFVLVGLPVWLFARIDLWQARSGRPVPALSLNLAALAVAGCLLAVTGSYLGWMAKTAWSCSKCGQVLPYAEYAEGLRAAGFEPGTVLVLGGLAFMPAEQMRQVMPQARYRRPDDDLKAGFAPPPNAASGDCVAVWNDSRSPEVGAALRAGTVQGVPALPDDTVWGTVQGRLALGGRPAPALGFALVEGGLGPCR